MKESQKRKPKEYRTPTYSLDEMKKLVKDGKIQNSRRVLKFVTEHCDKDVSVLDVAQAIFEDLTKEDFVKSQELEYQPGIMADIYIGGWYNDSEWYVKAFIERWQ